VWLEDDELMKDGGGVGSAAVFPIQVALVCFYFPPSVSEILSFSSLRSLCSRSTFQRFPAFVPSYVFFSPCFPISFPLFLPSHGSFLCFKTSLPF
jgi:hypothetical protein